MFSWGMDSFISHWNSQNSCRRAWRKPSKSLFAKSAVQSPLAFNTSLVGTSCRPGLGLRCGDTAEDNTDKVAFLTELGIQVTWFDNIKHHCWITLCPCHQSAAKGCSDYILKSIANKRDSPELSKRRQLTLECSLRWCRFFPSPSRKTGREPRSFEKCHEAVRVHIPLSGMKSSGRLEI